MRYFHGIKKLFSKIPLISFLCIFLFKLFLILKDIHRILKYNQTVFILNTKKDIFMLYLCKQHSRKSKTILRNKRPIRV